MFRLDYPYSLVLLLHLCRSISVYAWENADKKPLVESRFRLLVFSVSSADISLIPSHCCHCRCCLMESICLKCLHGWLSIGPKFPNAPRPFWSANHRIIVLDTWSARPRWVRPAKPCAALAPFLLHWRSHIVSLSEDLLFHRKLHRSHRLCARSCDLVITVMMSW